MLNENIFKIYKIAFYIILFLINILSLIFSANHLELKSNYLSTEANDKLEDLDHDYFNSINVTLLFSVLILLWLILGNNNKKTKLFNLIVFFKGYIRINNNYN